MQSDEIQQARVVADFLMAARRYFGLALAEQPGLRRRVPYFQLRPCLRSLLVLGSLGTVLAQPVFAMETMRSANERETATSSSKREVSALPLANFAALAEKSSRD